MRPDGEHRGVTSAAHDPPARPVTGPPLASPIDLVVPSSVGGQVTVISRPTAMVRRGTAHGWIPLGDAGALLLGTATACLRSVVVRMAGEHRIEGVLPPAEIQLRYAAEEGAGVIVSVPVVKGLASPGLDDLVEGLLDVRALLPRPRGFLAYQGTETVPPFQRPVMWLVSQTPLTARTRQLVAMLDRMPLPPRRSQPSEGRPIVRLSAKVLVLHEADRPQHLTPR
jgi:hypothetical protein